MELAQYVLAILISLLYNAHYVDNISMMLGLAMFQCVCIPFCINIDARDSRAPCSLTMSRKNNAFFSLCGNLYS